VPLLVALLAFTFWRTTVYAIFATLFIEGFLRNLLNTPNVLLAKDLLLAAVYLRVFGSRLIRGEDLFPASPINLPFATFSAFVLVQALNPQITSPGQAVVGVRAVQADVRTAQRSAGLEPVAVPPAALRAVLRVMQEHDAALRFLSGFETPLGVPLVVKADGLAAGKGVSVCADLKEARAAVRAMMVDGIHGAAGRRVVIEKALRGTEVSLLALVDREHVVPLPVAQDHKRLGEGDTGPNTGGMGAYAPVPFLDTIECDRLTDLALRPIAAALAEDGCPYHGVLFAGLMLTESGPHVLEYNCRFGDPEAQVILPLLADDLLPWLDALADGGGLDGLSLGILHGSAVGVVLAAEGYPEKSRTGVQVEGLDEVPPDTPIFHAGTVLDATGRVVTAGGRVLTVVGLGATVEDAARRAYAAPVRFAGMQRRSDIAWQVRVAAPPMSAGHGCRGDDVARPCMAAPSRIDPVALPRPARLQSTGADTEVRATSWGDAEVLAMAAEARRRTHRIGVLVSGEGSNLQALLDAFGNGSLDAEVAVVVSHRAEARALRRAEDAGVPAYALPLENRRDPDARRRHEKDLLRVLARFDLDLVVLAGWMLILSPTFLAACPYPLVNIHPALLDDPDLPVLRGAHAVRDALTLGLPYTGVSVHRVTAEVDAGPVILREPVHIEPGDDETSLYRRVKAVEHRLLPRAVQTVLSSLYPGGVHA